MIGGMVNCVAWRVASRQIIASLLDDPEMNIWGCWSAVKWNDLDDWRRNEMEKHMMDVAVDVLGIHRYQAAITCTNSARDWTKVVALSKPVLSMIILARETCSRIMIKYSSKTVFWYDLTQMRFIEQQPLRWLSPSHSKARRSLLIQCFDQSLNVLFLADDIDTSSNLKSEIITVNHTTTYQNGSFL